MARELPFAPLTFCRKKQIKSGRKTDMTTNTRIGVLTSGGDCPGLNAVIRGVVKSAGRVGCDVVGFRRGYEGLVDPVSYLPLDTRNTLGIINRGGTILGSTNKGRFAARVGVDGRLDLDPQLLDGVARTVEQLSLGGAYLHRWRRVARGRTTVP